MVLTLFGLGLTHHLASSTSAVLDVVKLAFALVAGVGGSIGLVLAYRRHKIAEAAVLIDKAKEAREARKEGQELRREDREIQRSYNERFGAAAAQLGSDSYAVRLAGVYAMVALADDWDAGRQQCVNVLCAILRRPLASEPDEITADREIKTAISRSIADRLRDKTENDWQNRFYDFTGATFDFRISFSGALFKGPVTFSEATFDSEFALFERVRFAHNGTVSFTYACFKSGQVSFADADFSAGHISFDGARLAGGRISFNGAAFRSGFVTYRKANFHGGSCTFDGTRFSGAEVRFDLASFAGTNVSFNAAIFSEGTIDFVGATIAKEMLSFRDAYFQGSIVSFNGMKFIGGKTSFKDASFENGLVSFVGARLTAAGKIDLSAPRLWIAPPAFSTDEMFGVSMPGETGKEESEIAYYDGPKTNQ